MVFRGAVLAGQGPDNEIFNKLAFDQKLDAQIPLDLTFTDEQGNQVPLRNYFVGKPVVLNLVYYECPMLCNQVLNGMVLAMRGSRLNVGEDYEIVTVSIDPHETSTLASEKKAGYVRRYGRVHAAEGWHFLTGDDAMIHKLAASIGFKYFWDSTSQLYAHPAGFVITTPTGLTSRYLYGVNYTSKDLTFSLIEASNGKIGSPVEKFLLLCYHYDPMTGKYGVLIMNVLRIAGVITILFLAGFILYLLRREKKGGYPGMGVHPENVTKNIPSREEKV